MRTNLLIIILCSIGLVSCNTTDLDPNSLEAQLEGKWIMHQVFLKGNDITKEHDLEEGIWVNFTTEGQYESGGMPDGMSTGNWNMDETQSILKMKSQTREKSAWKVSVNGDKLVWTGVGNMLDNQIQLVLKRDWESS